MIYCKLPNGKEYNVEKVCHNALLLIETAYEGKCSTLIPITSEIKFPNKNESAKIISDSWDAWDALR